MSFQAMSWAIAQEFARSSEKFVLVCMSNYADERGICYPSISRLEKDTCQDRKTIIGNIKKLIDAGYLADTGRRVGETGGVIVYRLTGIPESSKSHFVYRLTNPDTGEYYFGKRSCDGDPEADIYRGSGKWPRDMKDKGVFLHREIVATFQTSEEAIAHEAQILRAITDDPLCMNHERPYINRKNAIERQNGTVPKTEQFQNSSKAVPFSTGSSTENGTQNLLQPINNQSSNTRATAGGYTHDFETAWSAYPKRAGGNSKKEAFKAWEARIKAGVPAEVMIAGVERYRAFCDASGSTGTQFVKQAASFFGPGDHYESDWEAPPQRQQKPSRLDVSPEFKRDKFVFEDLPALPDSEQISFTE